MRRYLLVLIGIATLILTNNIFAGMSGLEQRTRLNDNDGDTYYIKINTTETRWTETFPTSNLRSLSCSYRIFDNDGAIDLKLEVEEGYPDLTPSQEHLTNSQYVEGEGIPDIDSSLTDKNWHHASITVIGVKNGRIKITGNASNAGNTYMELYLNRQFETN